MRPFDESELPPSKPPSLEDAVSEGLMLAEYAGRLKLKNKIIVGALTREQPYDPTQYLGDARAVLIRLASESERDADRVAGERQLVATMQGKAAHAHDYRYADAPNLEHREAVSVALAETLRARGEDNDYLLGFIESARSDAWADVSRAVEDSLDRSNIVVDADYERDRDKRMRLLVSEDLAKLAAKSAR